MFKVNDTIIYGSEGICQIVAIEENDFVGVKKTYYVMKPLGKDSSTTYVPIDSEMLVARMRKLLTKKEINELIDALPNEPIKWLSPILIYVFFFFSIRATIYGMISSCLIFKTC